MELTNEFNHPTVYLFGSLNSHARFISIILCHCFICKSTLIGVVLLLDIQKIPVYSRVPLMK